MSTRFLDEDYLRYGILVSHGEEFLARLGHFPVELRRLSLQKPTLEDAFIALTGHSIRPDETSSRDVLRRMVRMRRRS